MTILRDLRLSAPAARGESFAAGFFVRADGDQATAVVARVESARRP